VTPADPTEEWTQGAVDLCAWGVQEGMVPFIIPDICALTVAYIGPTLPFRLVASELRKAADRLEAQQPPDRLN